MIPTTAASPIVTQNNVTGLWQHNGIKINIIELLLQRTGTYNDMFRRPYTAQVDQYELNAIDNVINSNNKKVSPLAIASIANDVLKPSASYDKQLIMPGGWNEKRVRFVMKVLLTHHCGTQEVEVIQGYTDHFGVNTAFKATNEWTIDEHGMTFYINSITKTRQQQFNTPFGVRAHTLMTGNEHVLSNYQWDGMYTNNRDMQIRPQDVFMMIDAYGSGMPTDTVITNNISTDTSMLSSRLNNNSANYMSKIINSYATSNTEQNFYNGASDVLNQAIGYAHENDVSKDIFVYILNKSRQTPFGSTSFTYADLMRIDPNIVNVTKPLDDASLVSQLGSVGSTSFWNGSDRNTQLATMIAQSTPGLMLQSVLTTVSLYSTNESGEVVTTITNCHSYNTGDLSKYINSFINSFNMDIANAVSMNNGEVYRLMLSLDLAGETRISLKLGSDQQYDYVCPSFADALMAPVTTSNQQGMVNLVGNLEAILSNSFGTKAMNAGGGGIDFTDRTQEFTEKASVNIPVISSPNVSQQIPVTNNPFATPLTMGDMGGMFISKL